MSFFISIEGFDGTGKSTQSKLLKDGLEKANINSIIVREPGSTNFSEKIRNIIKENTEIEIMTELLLFQTSRSELVSKVIKPNLEKGKVVITDRYTDSSIAYQGYGGGIDINLIEELNKISTSDLTPNLTFLLDMDVKDSIERTLKRNNEENEQIDKFENKDFDFHEKVKNGFNEIMKKNKNRVIKIDASKEIEVISKKILNITLEKINETI
ncbi:MAG: dTMP kinase [Dehalococcoidia bacterium]|nr:dTMP kinase [Chloroflexota bacterium]